MFFLVMERLLEIGILIEIMLFLGVDSIPQDPILQDLDGSCLENTSVSDPLSRGFVGAH
jgi:hypothetical protein